MKRILFALFFSLLLAVTPVMAKTLSMIAAVINDEIITTLQLDKAVVAALASNPDRNKLTAEQFEQMKVQVLKNMVGEKLGLKVSKQELASAIDDVQIKNGLTRETLEQALMAQGLTMATYSENITKEILRYKLLSREVNYKVLVTSSEVRDYFNNHVDEYTIEARIRVNRISFEIPADSDEQDVELRKRVETSRDLLLNGEKFNKVLAAQGDSATGGDMGYLVEADLAEVLQLALADLKPGGVTKAVALNGLIHLFQVTERTATDSDLFDQVKQEIEEKLKRAKTNIRFEEWQKELRDNARVDIRIE
ncbi:MAG: peptidyl-prolyl cis-trans isomerase [Thermodesulfobacteriota bacterium]|nr:peptidyl-prolyl cis-trans isomerase [Thermodesulfobacteriota bacterium]